MIRVSGHVVWRSTDQPVAYSAQTAWLRNASLQDNIVFGESFDEERFQTVIEACALQPDIAILPAGQLTEIGEKVSAWKYLWQLPLGFLGARL